MWYWPSYGIKLIVKKEPYVLSIDKEAAAYKIAFLSCSQLSWVDLIYDPIQSPIFYGQRWWNHEIDLSNLPGDANMIVLIRLLMWNQQQASHAEVSGTSKVENYKNILSFKSWSAHKSHFNQMRFNPLFLMWFSSVQNRWYTLKYILQFILG